MRVIFCKFYCPSICFSKLSFCTYHPCSLRLEGAHHVSSSSVSHVVVDKPSPERIEGKEKESDKEKVDVLLKSSLKKSSVSGTKEDGKKRVIWMDLVGKELVEIKEFEPIESGEAEDRGSASSQACICVIQ